VRHVRRTEQIEELITHYTRDTHRLIEPIACPLTAIEYRCFALRIAIGISFAKELVESTDPNVSINTIVQSFHTSLSGVIVLVFFFPEEIATMKSICLKTMGLTAIITQLLSGCAIESKFDDPGDSKITDNVKAQFEEHPGLGPPNWITVSTRNHVVYLSGLVDTGPESADAETIAREVPGVTQVVSSIAVEQ
jgi:osmotically-inducible protein OsmY